jgi:hypothetical protein
VTQDYAAEDGPPRIRVAREHGHPQRWFSRVSHQRVHLDDKRNERNRAAANAFVKKILRDRPTTSNTFCPYL